MFVESLCGVIFGIYQHGKYAQLSTRDAEQGIAQQDAAQPFALTGLIHREAAQYRGWYDGIAREFLNDFRSQSAQRSTGCGEGVETDDFRCLPADRGLFAYGHEARDDAPLDILRGLFVQIAIQCGGTARETGTVAGSRQCLNPKTLRQGLVHDQSAMSFEGTQERVRRRLRIQQHRRKLFLGFA